MQLFSICTDQLSSHSRERSDVQYEQTPKKPAELLPVPKVILLSLVFGILVIFSEQLYNVLKTPHKKKKATVSLWTCEVSVM